MYMKFIKLGYKKNEFINMKEEITKKEEERKRIKYLQFADQAFCKVGKKRSKEKMK